MDFTSCFILTPGLFCFSPDATMLAYASGSAIVVRDAETLVVRANRNALGNVSGIEFSPDSMYILAATEEAQAIQVWRTDSADDAENQVSANAYTGVANSHGNGNGIGIEANAKAYSANGGAEHSAQSGHQYQSSRGHAMTKSASQSPASGAAAIIPCRYFGVTKACWHSTQRVVVSWSDFGLYLLFWDLVSEKLWAIKSLKHAAAGCAFNRSDGRFCAVLARHENKDAIKIFDTLDKETVQCFQIDTIAAADLAWSPDERYIAVWDSSFCYKLLVYRRDGKQLANYVAYEHALGISCVAWSPTSQFLAVGSCDQKIRILNNITFKPILEWAHSNSVSVAALRNSSNVKSVTVFMEHGMHLKSNSSLALSSLDKEDNRIGHGGYQKLCPPFNVTFPHISSHATNPAKSDGFSLLIWSPDGLLLAARSDLTPSVVTVYSILARSRQVILCHSQAIKHMEWHPRAKGTLVLCTGTQQLFFWHSRLAGDEMDLVFDESDEEDVDMKTGHLANEAEHERELLVGEYSGTALALTIPENGFCVQGFKWSSDGTRVAVFSKRSFCIGFERRPPARAHLRAAMEVDSASDDVGGDIDMRQRFVI